MKHFPNNNKTIINKIVYLNSNPENIYFYYTKLSTTFHLVIVYNKKYCNYFTLTAVIVCFHSFLCCTYCSKM